MKRERVTWVIRSPRIPEKLRLAVVSDLHAMPYEDVLEELLNCDAVLLPGDLVDRHRRNNDLAGRFLKDVPEKVPVFYSVGNHEVKFHRPGLWREWLRESGARLLDDEKCLFRGICLAGVSSTLSGVPDQAFLDRLEKEEQFTLLMCHQPEMYRDYVRGRKIDLTICGHAHGGQIQICGRGLYAPGQGLFPQITHGAHDGGRMIISRGMSNAAKPRIPRFGNPCELILLDLEPGEKRETWKKEGENER